MKLSKDGKGILYITIFLTIFGIIMVLSSSWPTAVSEHRAWYYYGLRQGIFALLGFIFMKFTSVFNNENYKKMHCGYLLLQFFCVCLFLHRWEKK